jgi:arginine exporter protein ArgO
VAGVFVGSSLWWLILSLLAGGLRDRLRPALLHRVNVAAGAVVAGFGLWLLATLGR